MPKINPADFGQSRPKLEQDDFNGTFTVLTVAGVEEVNVTDDEAEDGKRRSLVMTFQETGDKSLWLNVTAIKTLCERLGDNTDKWVGQSVPVEKHTAEFRGKKFPKVRVALAEEWDDMLKQAKKARSARR